jgi:class 3 adenylate cyclase
MLKQKHRLAAIMFTDVVGYTALMDVDEDKAFQLLERNRAIQRPIIEKHKGTWLKEMGDGVLASFETVSAAVYCAKEIQETCDSEPDLSLRIGIHLGEVIVQEADVLGSGVNIASRLEELAPAGGIYISESVHKNVTNRKGIETKFVKETILTHVREPVRIYEVMVEGAQIPSIAPIPPTSDPSKLTLKKGVLMGGGIILLLLVVFAIFQFRSKDSSITTSMASNKAIDKTIAVLPFRNDSDEEGTEYFANGVMESI